VGVIRVISDTVQRSVFYDFIVHPEYQGRGFGRTLLADCLEKYQHTRLTPRTDHKPEASLYIPGSTVPSPL
jgi:ribosomal protein S18 acetylase RimI-like enzyme